MKKIVLILGISLFLITGCGQDKKEFEKAIANNHENVIKEQKLNTITFKKVSLIYQDGISTFSVDLYNESQENIYVSSFKAIFKNQNGTEITSLEMLVEDYILPQTSLTATMTSDIDLSEAYSVEYVVQ